MRVTPGDDVCGGDEEAVPREHHRASCPGGDAPAAGGAQHAQVGHARRQALGHARDGQRVRVQGLGVECLGAGVRHDPDGGHHVRLAVLVAPVLDLVLPGVVRLERSNLHLGELRQVSSDRRVEL